MLTAVLALLSFLAHVSQAPACDDVASCRQAALEAAEQKAFESFHDLAWRAVQKGRRNDPELMLLLARAQSLSGRPGDALVMLRRLSEVGDARDAITSDDFARVRALPGWADVEAAMVAASKTRAPGSKSAARGAAPVNKASPEKPAASSGESTGRPAKPESPKLTESPKSFELLKRSEPAKLVDPPVRRSPVGKSVDDGIRLPAATLEPVGLAYDSVSRRFVVGDRRQNRLIVADEIFKSVNDLIGAGSGGFGALTAIEIDRRRGDLWVTSSAGNGSASVHKLQLVSGRVLARIDVPEDWRPAALNDISMSDGGELVLVDAAGSRLLILPPSSQVFARSVPLGLSAPVSIAPAGAFVYVAHSEGLSVVDLGSREVTEVRPGKGVALIGLRRIRWFQGSLVAIQDDPDEGTARLVRIRINQSRNLASRVEPLDEHVAEDGSVLTIAGRSVYYVARTDEGPTIRRVALR